MRVLGIETSCDETAAAVVADGTRILSNVVLSQASIHSRFSGVVPEIASRKHIEWIDSVVNSALDEAGCNLREIDAIAATYRPGLIGSLLVGLTYAKTLALAVERPFLGIDHIEAHVYAPHMEHAIDYPYLGLLVSGGHTLITRVKAHDRFDVLGTTIDDACGEAFDKVAKYFQMGYPGGVVIDRLADAGDPAAYRFPIPSLHKADHRYDVSYSGLKTAVIHQRRQFLCPGYTESLPNLAAGFRKAAIDMIVDRALAAARDLSLTTIVAGGGVAANSYLRRRMAEEDGLRVVFPSLALCTDNAAMIAGLAYHRLRAGETSPLGLNAAARVPAFRRR